MIQIKCQNERFAYDMYHIVKSFFPDAEIIQTIDREQESLIWIQIDSGSCFLGCREAEGHEFTIMPSEVETLPEGTPQKRYVNKKLYRMLEELTGQTHAWGNMTGVRPTKMIMMHLDQGESEEEVVQYMYDTFLVTPKKTRLGIEIARRERKQLSKLDYENGYSLYIHIPFCPTICSYCSFTSYPIDKWTGRMDAYVEALMKEIEAISRMMAGKKLNAVYMGGGTPTALSAEQMDRVLGCVESHFSYEHLKEFTVEAGRPDSITREKLQVIYDHGVRRISINPQSMQQKTLDEIGRCHTVQDIVDTFHLAREIGFSNINMDLIAGLPGECPEDMADTLRRIKELDPDNLTVHALAMKHGSRMTRAVKEGKSENVLSNSETKGQLEEMIDMARDAADEMQMSPYYLYRQKNIAGNFENVGYAKEGKAGIYNILIMEEVQSIIAAGAGSTTKIVLPEKIPAPGSKNGRMTNMIRIENVKQIEDYIAQIDDMIKRKEEWLWH